MLGRLKLLLTAASRPHMLLFWFHLRRRYWWSKALTNARGIIVTTLIPRPLHGDTVIVAEIGMKLPV